MPHICRNDLTADGLRRQVSYDPETGLFSAIPGNRVAVSRLPNGNGYLRVSIDRVSYKAHRLAWLYFYGEWPKNTIDHINGDRCDNRISNLRDVPHAENQLNLKRHRAGFLPHPKIERTPKRVGTIYYIERLEKWGLQYKKKYLGLFKDKEDAERHLARFLKEQSAQ